MPAILTGTQPQVNATTVLANTTEAAPVIDSSLPDGVAEVLQAVGGATPDIKAKLELLNQTLGQLFPQRRALHADRAAAQLSLLGAGSYYDEQQQQQQQQQQETPQQMLLRKLGLAKPKPKVRHAPKRSPTKHTDTGNAYLCNLQWTLFARNPLKMTCKYRFSNIFFQFLALWIVHPHPIRIPRGAGGTPSA